MPAAVLRHPEVHRLHLLRGWEGREEEVRVVQGVQGGEGQVQELYQVGDDRCIIQLILVWCVVVLSCHG